MPTPSFNAFPFGFFPYSISFLSCDFHDFILISAFVHQPDIWFRIKIFRGIDSCFFPDAFTDQFQREGGSETCLGGDSLVVPAFHRFLVVKWLVQELYFILPVFFADTVNAYQHFSNHLISDIFWLRSAGCYYVSWNNGYIPHLYRMNAAKSQFVQHF